MRTILVVNSKGGCGKTTLATNLAGYYAVRGKNVALADYDPQGSSMAWLEARHASRPPITGVEAYANPLRVPSDTDYTIIDSPAALHGRALSELVRKADTILMPVLPSPIDVRAARNFISEINKLRKVVNADVKLATVANRVRENTLAASDLDEYLDAIRLPSGKKLPYLAHLRASQNYIHAAGRGLSIFEFAPVKTLPDREQWARIFRWINQAGKAAAAPKVRKAS